MLKDSKHDCLFSPPSPFAIEIQLNSLAREAKLSVSDPAVVPQGMATLQTPGESQEDCHRSTEVLMAFVISLRGKAACKQPERGHTALRCAWGDAPTANFLLEVTSLII